MHTQIQLKAVKTVEIEPESEVPYQLPLASTPDRTCTESSIQPCRRKTILGRPTMPPNPPNDVSHEPEPYRGSSVTFHRESTAIASSSDGVPGF